MSDAPLFLIHPFPMDARFWEPMLGALATDRAVISHDLPGFGSAAPAPGWSIRGAAEAVAARIAEETPDGRAVVVGCSMGGYVALALMASAPERVAGLVLADTRAEADTPEAREGRAAAIASLNTTGAEPFLDGFVPKLLAPDASAELLTTVRKVGLSQGADTLATALAALRDRADRVAELPRIRVPTLVIVGDQDALTPLEAAQTLAEGIPGARLTVVPGAGHLAAIEDPRTFADSVAEFLSGR